MTDTDSPTPQPGEREGCPFCEHIDTGEFDPTEDPRVVSFIPLDPVTPGHRLFVPRRHVETAATDPDVTGATFAQAARWGRGSGNQGPRRGFNLITSAGECATQTVRHLHVHYVQRRPSDGLHLPWTVTPRPTTDNPSRDEVTSWPCACGHDKTRHLKNGLQCLVGVCRCMHWTATAQPGSAPTDGEVDRQHEIEVDDALAVGYDWRARAEDAERRLAAVEALCDDRDRNQPPHGFNLRHTDVRAALAHPGTDTSDDREANRG